MGYPKFEDRDFNTESLLWELVGDHQQAFTALERDFAARMLDKHIQNMMQRYVDADRVMQAKADADVYGYASRLAQAIWSQHFREIAPQWGVLPDTLGVLTQIDNMVSGQWPAEWQPIESAPKETELLGWREDCGAMLIMHTSYDRFANDRECDEIDEETLFQKDWFGAFIPGGMTRLDGSETPTHWMLLPQPPKA